MCIRDREEVAEALGCECLEIRDKIDRGGTMGYLRCCFDAMHKRTSAVSRPKCARPLSDYKLVILGTPVWAGRCSSAVSYTHLDVYKRQAKT